MNASEADCWVITDGAAGNVRQADALATALRRHAHALTVDPHAPWSWLAPRLTLAAAHALPKDARSVLQAAPPPLVIGCGRAAALYTRLLRQRSNGRCQAVQILDPRIPGRHWDLLIAPRHDAVQGSNVLRPLGSLHPVDDAWLDAARATFRHFAALPSPRLGVLLGGPRRGIAMDAAFREELLHSIRARLEREGGSIMLVASRRTPPALIDAVANAVAHLPGLIWRHPGDGANPYPGILAWADRLLVTPDSVNMLSEACAVGCAVHTLAPAHLPTRLARFHAALRQRGLLHDAHAQAPPRQTPLRETARIADAVAQRLHLHTG